MVKRLTAPLRRWPAFEAALTKLAAWFKSWPADDYGRFINPSVGTGMAGGIGGFPPVIEPERPAVAPSIPPATFEMTFMRLHAQGRFDEMWEMLAEDAQRAWGGREAFMRDMPRLDDETELLDMQALSVAVLDGWTDRAHQRTYSNVARLVMRYRVRQRWREWTFDRQVHLIPAGGGWRTLLYPTKVRTAIGH